MISPFSIDTFFPSFRAMAAEFQLTEWQIQQTLTAYMLPYALTALLHGALSDALGRRTVVLGGLIFYTAASLACVFAASFTSLLLFRALQGMTAGTGLIVGRAIIRDLYQGPAAQRLMAVVTLIFGIAPAIAPVIGGWIHVTAGWRNVFSFMVLVGVVLIAWTAWRLPETHPPTSRTVFDTRQLFANMWHIASHQPFLLLAISAALNFATMLTFVGAAPALVLDHWGLSETEFFHLFVPIIIGFTIGAMASARLAGRMAASRQVTLGFGLAICGTTLMCLLDFVMTPPPRSLQQATLVLITAGIQLALPVLTLRMLDLFPQLRGSVASVQSFISLVIASLIIGIMVPLLSHSLLSLACGALVLSSLAYVFWWRALLACQSSQQSG
jgi:MFS transporter, DHA1 family, multidrug resistance protein